MEENKSTENQNETQEVEKPLNQEELRLITEKLRLEQNLPFAIIASLGSAVVMAILWAVITVVTQYQIGYTKVNYISFQNASRKIYL